ncbi:MAG: penicillin-binding transpeptidase domain-containing protein, partial [Pseudohongiellaceae bacterium]
VEKNARGQVMKVLDRTDPVPGQDIVLHLDSALQLAADAALGDKRGAIVALDTTTAGVLALVSKPAYDPNLFVQGISQAEFAKLNNPRQTPLFNRALGKYAPGSTIKPFLGLASLEYGIRTREYTITDPGHYRLPGASGRKYDWTWWVSKDGHGIVNLQKAIFQSCDIYFYDLATDMSIEQMHDFLFRFGFGRNTSIDLAQASTGTLPSSAWKRENIGEPWYPGDSLNSSIGQGYTEATPLQLATATLVLANKGRWQQPAMLRRIGRDGEDIQRKSRIPDIRLQNPDDWDFMAEAMSMVVHKGTGGYRNTGSAYSYIAMNKKMEYRMAGKSGTAQVVGMAPDFDKNAEVVEQFRDHAHFISFAPVEDPKIAVAVFVEHGEGGSSVAGPIAREIIDAYLLGNNGATEGIRQITSAP